MMMSNRYRDDRSGEVETRIRERLFDTGIAGCRGMLADCEEDFDAFLEMYRSRVTVGLLNILSVINVITIRTGTRLASRER